eukprot:Gb_10235 [translate_table: standard]
MMTLLMKIIFGLCSQRSLGSVEVIQQGEAWILSTQSFPIIRDLQDTSVAGRWALIMSPREGTLGWNTMFALWEQYKSEKRRKKEWEISGLHQATHRGYGLTGTPKESTSYSMHEDKCVQQPTIVTSQLNGKEGLRRPESARDKSLSLDAEERGFSKSKLQEVWMKMMIPTKEEEHAAANGIHFEELANAKESKGFDESRK